MNQAENFVAGGAAENFLMACVVDDETQLSENKRQKSGVAEFGPRILKPLYEQERGYQHCEIKKYLPAVIRGLLRQ